MNSQLNSVRATGVSWIRLDEIYKCWLYEKSNANYWGIRYHRNFISYVRGAVNLRLEMCSSVTVIGKNKSYTFSHEKKLV